MKNINVFVGSSTESIKVAEAIQSNLQKIVGRKGVSINVQIWHQGLCRIGDYTLTSLIEGARKFDYAILVFGPDAEIEERGERLFVPRDNVVFELGLFIGELAGNAHLLSRTIN